MKGNNDTVAMINRLDNILKRDPGCIDAILTKGDLYLALDSLGKAAEIFTGVSFSDTGNVYALYRLGIAYQLDEKNDAAVFAFQKAIKLKSHGGRAITDYMQAANNITELSKYDVNSAELMYRQGISYYYLRNLQAAYDNFNFCLSNNYLLDKVYLYRGSIYYETNQKKEACNDFSSAQRYGNPEANEYLNRYCQSGHR